MSNTRILAILLGASFLCLAGGDELLGPMSMALGGPGKAWAATGEPSHSTEWVGRPTEGDDYVGSEECLDCHDELEKSFEHNVHSKAAYWDLRATGCEACHGPGAAHAESDGDVVIGTPADLESTESNAVCLSCHDGGIEQTYWQGSAHETMDVSCVSCHNIHSGLEHLLNSRSEAKTCYECHPEQRNFVFKRSHHPMTDATRKSGLGKTGCSSCHNPHGSQSEKLIAANTINDKCYECHREMEAPVLWEHSPVKESCLNCHNAHGSNYPNLLVLQRTRLCQGCHEAGRHQTVAGQETSFLVLNRQCSNCHAQVHGSNHPGGLKLKR